MPSQANNNINQNGATTSSSASGGGSSRSTANASQNDPALGTNNSSNQHASDIRRLSDPFLFYSDNRNLERARHFQRVDYSNQEVGHDVERRTRISFEVDAVTLMADLFLNDVGGGD